MKHKGELFVGYDKRELVDALRKEDGYAITNMLYNEEGLELFKELGVKYNSYAMTAVSKQFVKDGNTFLSGMPLTEDDLAHIINEIINVPILMSRKGYKKTAQHLYDLVGIVHKWKEFNPRKKVRYFAIFTHAYYYHIKGQFKGNFQEYFGHPVTYLDTEWAGRKFSKAEIDDFKEMYTSDRTYAKYGDIHIKHEPIKEKQQRLCEVDRNLYNTGEQLTNDEWYYIFVCEVYRRYVTGN